MPFATADNMRPISIETRLAPAPVTQAPGDMAWSQPWGMGYHAGPQELFAPDLSGLGEGVADRLDLLPKRLVRAFAEEMDPEIVDYLRDALQTPNPYATILDDLAAAELEGEGLADFDDDGLGSLKKKLKRVVKKVREVHKKIEKKIVPKALIKAKEKVEEARKKIHQKVRKAGKKVWKKYGNVIIGIAGIVLAPFTGGASLAAASVLTAANTMYQTKRNADAAKKAAKKEAKQLAAEANQQEVEVKKQVDEFYNQNKDWFYQYGMTDAEWAGLTLDQKISFINAGAEGKFQATAVGDAAAPTPPPSEAPSAPPSYRAPSYPSGAPSGAGPAPGAPMPGGGEAVYGPPPGAPAGEAPPAPEGTYDVVIEGQKAGTFKTLDEASSFVMANTSPGDRFEVFLNGQSTGLNVRTSKGAVEVPAAEVERMRALSREEVVGIVNEAEKKGGGKFPWWMLLVGGAAAAVAVSAA